MGEAALPSKRLQVYTRELYHGAIEPSYDRIPFGVSSILRVASTSRTPVADSRTVIRPSPVGFMSVLTAPGWMSYNSTTCQRFRPRWN